MENQMADRTSGRKSRRAAFDSARRYSFDSEAEHDNDAVDDMRNGFEAGEGEEEAAGADTHIGRRSLRSRASRNSSKHNEEDDDHQFSSESESDGNSQSDEEYRYPRRSLRSAARAQQRRARAPVRSLPLPLTDAHTSRALTSCWIVAEPKCALELGGVAGARAQD
jgi:hypothetical protein